jgi:hypothetical protein
MLVKELVAALLSLDKEEQDYTVKVYDTGYHEMREIGVLEISPFDKRVELK